MAAATPAVVPASPTPLRLVLLGDMMLGRMVDDSFTCSTARKTAAFGDVLPWLHSFPPSSTIVAGNLECAITSHSTPTPKAFNFKLSPNNADVLQHLRLGFAATANNHVLDYGQPGLAETNEVLTSLGIAHAGSGTQATASQPAVVATPDGHRVAFLSYSDHYEEWRAAATQPGINFIDPASFDQEQLRRQVAAARAVGPDLVVIMVHWGPNWRWQPDKHLMQLGRAFLAAGADLVFGTSPHHVQGVEVLGGNKAIIYSGGAFLDDYAGDDVFRNDLSAVWTASFGAASAQAAASSSPGVGAPGAAAGAADLAPAGSFETAGATCAAGAVQGQHQAAAAAGHGAAVRPAGGSQPSHTLVLQQLETHPIAITHHWRPRDEDGGPFEGAGGGNPPYFSQVDLAKGKDRQWVADKLTQLCGALGSVCVQRVPHTSGLTVQPLQGSASQATAGICDPARKQQV